MPYTAIWIHAVWATHQRHPWLTAAIRTTLYQHMREQANRQNIRLTDVNGFADHVHILFALAPDQTLAKVIQLLKGESSHWLNQQGFIASGPFRWQSEYWAGSVSPSGLARVRAYIAGQETHHQSMSFTEECELLFKGLEIAPDVTGSESSKG
ncbi:IS200/IS605 family transposase [Hymenobacter artigasi]|uniref:REP element-mobilizing transposase RayT n=1 Tax=Hymenobacter artigasi TaxID=2719616 RepID=A0ABX1HJW2_9BACT|nr:IS200/IS605 family transposase [Hymenobacter artigasi]NKI89332.1 REP element-mobilizing transposase RayT [Hymenobacter artigasi]